MSKTFLIVGDSWSQGEIEQGPSKEISHVIVHKGLEQYLLDEGHKVINKGKLGGSNWEAYWAVRSSYFDESHNGYPTPIGEPIDYILWFLTDPLRDWDKEVYIKEVNEIKSIKKFFTDKIDFMFNKMSELSAEIKLPIYVIGGWIPVPDSVSLYNNLQTLIPDVHKLLLPDSNLPVTHCAFHLYEYASDLSLISNNLTSNELNNLKQEIVDLINELNYSDRLRRSHKDLFYPDWYHPNRAGHYKIFETVQSLLLKD